MQVARIAPVLPVAPGTTETAAASTSVGPGSFAAAFSRALSAVEAAEGQANQLAVDYAAGRPVDLTDVVIASEKANLQVQLFAHVRNKVLEAWQEISRMPG